MEKLQTLLWISQKKFMSCPFNFGFPFWNFRDGIVEKNVKVCDWPCLASREMVKSVQPKPPQVLKLGFRKTAWKIRWAYVFVFFSPEIVIVLNFSEKVTNVLYLKLGPWNCYCWRKTDKNNTKNAWFFHPPTTFYTFASY